MGWIVVMGKKSLIYCCLITAVVMNPTRALSPPDDPINTIQSQGIVGLDFSRNGNNEQIALFIINNNCVTGFDVFFKFANGCAFRYGATQEIPMTSLVLDRVSGTLGAGLVEPVDVDILHNLSGGDEYTWNPGATQTTPTTNYIVELRASWDNSAGKLAGFYSEAITIIITIGV
jgi:hypothetical protein